MYGLAILLFSAPVFAREVPLTLLHTTDLHAHFQPTSDYDGNLGVGGLLQLEPLLEEQKASATNLLLIDCGDTIQGAPDGLLSGGELPVKALELLGYDAWVLGNHEFDWGFEPLARLVNHCSIPVLGANISTIPDHKHPMPGIKPFILREFDGVKIAVIGLNTPGIPYWTRPDYLGPIVIRDSLDALREVLPIVKEQGAQVVVLALHQGCKGFKDDFANQVRSISRAFPEIDVILGGHTHQVQEEIYLGETLYTQAGYHGIWFGRVDLVFDTESGRVVRRKSKVLHVGATTNVPDGKLSAEFGPRLESIRAAMEEVIGVAGSEIPASFDLPGTSPAQQLICRAIQEASGAEFVIHGVLGDGGIPKGPVTRGQVWKLVPYENRLGIAMLTVGEIRKIMDENLAHAGSFSFMGPFGFRCELVQSPGGKGWSVDKITLADGSIPHPRKRFATAFNSYVLASGGQKFPVLREIVDTPESRLEMLNLDTRSAVTAYFKKHSPVEIPPANLVGMQGKTETPREDRDEH